MAIFWHATYELFGWKCEQWVSKYHPVTAELSPGYHLTVSDCAHQSHGTASTSLSSKAARNRQKKHNILL